MEDFDGAGYIDGKMRERVNLGGFLVTREEAYRALQEAGHDRRVADYFAFAARAVDDAEAEDWSPLLTGYVNLRASDMLDDLELDG